MIVRRQVPLHAHGQAIAPNHIDGSSIAFGQRRRDRGGELLVDILRRRDQDEHDLHGDGESVSPAAIAAMVERLPTSLVACAATARACSLEFNLLLRSRV